MKNALNDRPTKKARMLENPDVQRWYNNLANDSRNTAEVAVRRLSLFCELNSTDPASLLKLQKKEALNLILDNVTRLQRKGKAGSYISGIVKSVKSWLEFNDITIEQKIKIKDANKALTLKNQEAVTPQKIDAVLASGDYRSKIECSLIGYSGLRLESLGNDNATDGILLGDLPELDLEALKFVAIPATIVVREPISKAGHQYFSFLNQRTCNFIVSYLMYRKAELGERLRKESPLIKATGRKKQSKLVPENMRNSDFIETRTVSDEIRRCIRKAGYRFRPYALRGYFDTQMMLAENNGKISDRKSVV